MSHGRSHGRNVVDDAIPLSPRSKSLHEAIASDNYVAANRLLDEGVHDYKADHMGLTPLMVLIKRDESAGHLGKMTLARALLAMRLLKLGADVNARDSDVNTALHHAVHNSDDWIYLLIDAGADKDAQNKHKETSTHVAPSLAADNLLRHTTASALRHAVRLGDAERVMQELIVLAERQNNTYEPQSDLELYVACHFGHQDVVQVLLESNIPANNVCQFRPYPQRTPLQLAAREGHDGVVRQLLARQVDVNLAGASGTTALMLAARNGHVTVVHTLIEARADVNRAEQDGATALQYAQWRGFTEIEQILLEAGAHPTPLHYDDDENGHAPDEGASAGSWCSVM